MRSNKKSASGAAAAAPAPDAASGKSSRGDGSKKHAGAAAAAAARTEPSVDPGGAAPASPGLHSHPHGGEHGHCVVCAETLPALTFSPCGHNDVCYLCVARMRLLNMNRACVVCKAAQEHIVITRAKEVDSYEGFGIYGDVGGPDLFLDHSSGMFFHKSAATERQHIIELRQFRCNAPPKKGAAREASAAAATEGAPAAAPTPVVAGPCKETFHNAAELSKHLTSAHGLHLCDLCVANRKVFVAQLPRFTPAELDKHCKAGDPAVGFGGHPLCKFCKKRHFSVADLFNHYERDHFSCHLCVKAWKTGQREYFSDHHALAAHFKEYHYVCEEEGCKAELFSAYDSELELKQHSRDAHGKELSNLVSHTNLFAFVPLAAGGGGGSTSGSGKRGGGAGKDGRNAAGEFLRDLKPAERAARVREAAEEEERSADRAGRAPTRIIALAADFPALQDTVGRRDIEAAAGGNVRLPALAAEVAASGAASGGGDGSGGVEAEFPSLSDAALSYAATRLSSAAAFATALSAGTAGRAAGVVVGRGAAGAVKIREADFPSLGPSPGVVAGMEVAPRSRGGARLSELLEAAGQGHAVRSPRTGGGKRNGGGGGGGGWSGGSAAVASGEPTFAAAQMAAAAAAAAAEAERAAAEAAAARARATALAAAASAASGGSGAPRRPGTAAAVVGGSGGPSSVPPAPSPPAAAASVSPARLAFTPDAVIASTRKVLERAPGSFELFKDLSAVYGRGDLSATDFHEQAVALFSEAHKTIAAGGGPAPGVPLPKAAFGDIIPGLVQLLKNGDLAARLLSVHDIWLQTVATKKASKAAAGGGGAPKPAAPAATLAGWEAPAKPWAGGSASGSSAPASSSASLTPADINAMLAIAAAESSGAGKVSWGAAPSAGSTLMHTGGARVKPTLAVNTTTGGGSGGPSPSTGGGSGGFPALPSGPVSTPGFDAKMAIRLELASTRGKSAPITRSLEAVTSALAAANVTPSSGRGKPNAGLDDFDEELEGLKKGGSGKRKGGR